MQIPQEEQTRTPWSEAGCNGKTLRDGEYLVQELLSSDDLCNVFLAVHTHFSLPLMLKQVRADQPLPEHVIAELDYLLRGGDITRLSAFSHSALRSGDAATSSLTYADRFLREALLLARLQHSAIPMLYDYFEEDGSWYLVIDYISGMTLKDYLQQQAPLSSHEALNYALQICDVLDYLHRQTPPIIFWDLRPENIMRTPGGMLMLTNFGMARSLKEETDLAQDRVDSQLAASSSLYAAPEQQDEFGFSHIDTRADLYSLGLILYEMLSGQQPTLSTYADPAGQINPSLTALSTSNYTLLSNVSHMLSSLVKLAIQPEPNERYQSAQTLYLALERAYRVEERHAYQRHLTELSGAEDALATQDAADHEDNEDNEREDEHPISPRKQANSTAEEQDHPDAWHKESLLFVPDLEQRRLTREALHRTRQERIELAQLESQLASFDESLQRRTSMSQSLYALGAQHKIARRSFFNPRRLIQISFFVALTLFLVMASLLVYLRFMRQLVNQAQPTPTTEGNALTIDVTPTPILHNNKSGPTSYWQSLPPLPQPMADNAAVLLAQNGNTVIYANGGYRGHALLPRYDHSLYRYDTTHQRWDIISNEQFPGMVNNAAATDEHGNLYFTAGYAPDSFRVPSLLYMYQPDNQQLKSIVPPTSMPLGFANAIFADHQGHLYMTQGFMSAGQPTVEAGRGWYRYDSATAHWQRLADLPVGLGYVILAGNNDGTILLFGGSIDAGQQHQTNKIYLYDIASNSWSQSATSMPQQISGASGCSVWPGQFAIVGGYNPISQHSLNTVWLFDMHTLKARALASIPGDGSVLGAAVCDNQGHMYVIRGASNPQKSTRDFLELFVQPDLTIDGH